MERRRNIARRTSTLRASAGTAGGVVLLALFSLALCFALPGNANAQLREEERQLPGDLSEPKDIGSVIRPYF
jgi:hypothetical protein